MRKEGLEENLTLTGKIEGNVAEEGRSGLLKIIRKKQLEFLGHVVRKEGLEENLTLTGKIEGKRSRGRQIRASKDN